MVNKMKEEIKSLRVEIDLLSKLTKSLRENENDSKFLFNSPECSKTYDSLMFAKAWLGKILGQLGEPTPYQNDGKRKTVGDIEDVSDGVPENRFFITKEYNDKNHIEKVDYLREEIQKLINNTSDFSEVYPEVELEQGFVYKYLTEAKMWLGFELGRVRDEHKELTE